MNRETLDLINDALDSNTPLLVKGVPGIGKTEILVAMCRERGWHVEVVNMASREPSEVAGMPRITPDGVEFCPPAWARRIQAAGAKGQVTVLFLDEITCCHPALQAPILRLIKDGGMDDWTLPADCRRIAAANPPELAAGGWDLTPPAANRVGHIEAKPDLDSWAEWNVTQPDPHGIRPSVVAFLKSRPSLFCSFPKDAQQQAGPNPTPRTWDMACKVRTDGLRAGLVGAGAYAEFLQWKNAADLPSPEDVLSGKASLPERADARFASLVGIAALAARDYKTYGKAAWGIIVQVAEKALDEAIVPARALATAAPTVPAELGKLAPALARITR